MSGREEVAMNDRTAEEGIKQSEERLKRDEEGRKEGWKKRRKEGKKERRGAFQEWQPTNVRVRGG